MKISKILIILVIFTITLMATFYYYTHTAKYTGDLDVRFIKDNVQFRPFQNYSTAWSFQMSRDTLPEKKPQAMRVTTRKPTKRPGLKSNDEEKRQQAKKRTNEYCNPVTNPVTGSEGKVIEGFKLEHIHVFIRHGDRSPMYVLPGATVQAMSCNMSLSGLPQEQILQDYVRYMQAVEVSLEPNHPGARLGLYPRSARCEGAQLTAQGVLQHLHNGQHLQTAYRRWLFGKEDPHSKIVVRSTDYSRTYQSSLAFMFGFLAELNFHRLKVRFNNMINFCSSRVTSLNCDCRVLGRLQYVTQREYTQRSRNSSLHNNIKAQMAKVLKVPTSKLPWVSAMMDVLAGPLCHNKPAPCSNSRPRYCVSWSLINDMWTWMDLSGRTQLSSFATVKFSRLLTFPLLYEVYHRMDNISKNIEKSRMYVYSGHDTTISSLLTTLGVSDGLWPPYASRLVFELYSGFQDTSKIYLTRVLFNGKDLTSKVIFCKNKPLPHGLCPLEYFENFMKYENLKVLGSTSYSEACMLK